MAFELYAHVCVPIFSTDAQGNPKLTSDLRGYKRVLVGTYATKLLAQWWGINLGRVYIDPPGNTMLATQQQIHTYEIVDIG